MKDIKNNMKKYKMTNDPGKEGSTLNATSLII